MTDYDAEADSRGSYDEAIAELRQRRVIISNFRNINKGALAATFDVEIPAWRLIIRECKLFSKNGQQWAGVPSSSFASGSGKTVYKDLIAFTDKACEERFKAAVLAALESET